MRLVLATDDLEIHGRNYAGFPLLLDDHCLPMEPAQTFLWHLLPTNGRIGSKKTWEKYGRDMFDYFAFLNANKIDWNAAPCTGMLNPIERYIEWSKGHLNLNPSTINSRVRIVVRFYRWAHKAKLIDNLPFEEAIIFTPGKTSFLIHVDANPKSTKSSSVLLKEQQPVFDILTKSQLALCLRELHNTTHRLILETITRSGLRQEEVRTLPEKYIFDPSRRQDLKAGQMIFVKLDPRDMKTKGSKQRIIEMPYSLMEDLWWWSVRHRPARAAKSNSSFESLFLTEAGQPYGDSALTSIFNRLSKKLGFPVRPHMGRHTYATYRLRSLKNSNTFQGDPLLYLMERLGHASVEQTTKYLKYVNMLEGELISQHEDELDDLFSKE